MTNRRRRTIRNAGICWAIALLVAWGAGARAQTPAAAPAATPAAAAPANWATYTYASDGFGADFPTAPELQKKNIPTAAGTFELRSYISTDGDVALFVGVADYGAAAAGKDPNTMLQGAKNGALQNANAHLLSEAKSTLGTYPGLNFEAENSSMHFSARLYMVGSTLYQTLVIYSSNASYAGTGRFLDSFHMVARTAN